MADYCRSHCTGPVRTTHRFGSHVTVVSSVGAQSGRISSDTFCQLHSIVQVALSLIYSPSNLQPESARTVLQPFPIARRGSSVIFCSPSIVTRVRENGVTAIFDRKDMNDTVAKNRLPSNLRIACPEGTRECFSPLPQFPSSSNL